MHRPPTEDDFCDEQGKAQKPIIVTGYNQHMGYIYKGDRMVNGHSFSQTMWKWTKNNFSITWT
jgi:hypothetical protein